MKTNLIGKRLFKENKRRCYVCSQIKDLSHFYKRKSPKHKGAHSYRYGCIECNKELNQRYRFRTRFIKERENKCEKCGIYNEDTCFFDVDHIDSSKKISQRRSGRASERDNLQVLCPNCHRIKGIKNGEIGRKQGIKTYGKVSRFSKVIVS